MTAAKNLWSIGLLFYILLIRLMPYLLELIGYSVDPATTVYPWNFSPVMAICLVAPVAFSRSHWRSALIPLGGMLLSDLAILGLKGPDFALYSNQPVVYACFGLGILLGHWLRNHRQWTSLLAAGLASECLFFAITNFGTWWFQLASPTPVYSADFSGLMMCYTFAIPFFGRSLLSTMIYGSVLYAAVGWLESREGQSLSTADGVS